MRKEYRKAVRKAFTLGLAETAPEMKPVKVDSPLLFSGETVFRWSPGAGFMGWLLLVPDQKRQAFTVEVGWSNQKRFPALGMRPSVMLGPDDPLPFDQPEGFVRLGALTSRTDRWWALPDPAMENPGSIRALKASLEPLDQSTADRDAERPVAEALSEFAESGMPFLEAMAKQAGVTGP